MRCLHFNKVNSNLMKNNKIYSDDKAMREAMQMSKKKASDNFKHRVMHQVMQEDVLKRKRQTSFNTSQPNVLKEILGVFGGMYAVLILLVLVAYFIKGQDFLMSTQFIYSALTVCVVFAVLCLITAIDAKVRRR